MSSTRARAIAAKEGLLSGTKGEQRIRAWLALGEALGPLHKQVQLDMLPPATVMGQALYCFALLCAIWDIDMDQLLDQTLTRKELATKKQFPGTTAPVPNSATNDGTLRDATGRAHLPE